MEEDTDALIYSPRALKAVMALETTTAPYINNIYFMKWNKIQSKQII